MVIISNICLFDWNKVCCRIAEVWRQQVEQHRHRSGYCPLCGCSWVGCGSGCHSDVQKEDFSPEVSQWREWICRGHTRHCQKENEEHARTHARTHARKHTHTTMIGWLEGWKGEGPMRRFFLRNTLGWLVKVIKTWSKYSTRYVQNVPVHVQKWSN